MVNPIIADAVTEVSGYTTISGTIAGGGCVLSDGVYLKVQNHTILEKPACTDPICLDIVIVSVDLNYDCDVNLSDFAQFGLSYNKNLGDPGYDPCCDYNDDNKVNLSDLGLFGTHY